MEEGLIENKINSDGEALIQRKQNGRERERERNSLRETKSTETKDNERDQEGVGMGGERVDKKGMRQTQYTRGERDKEREGKEEGGRDGEGTI